MASNLPSWNCPLAMQLCWTDLIRESGFEIGPVPYTDEDERAHVESLPHFCGAYSVSLGNAFVYVLGDVDTLSQTFRVRIGGPRYSTEILLRLIRSFCASGCHAIGLDLDSTLMLHSSPGGVVPLDHLRSIGLSMLPRASANRWQLRSHIADDPVRSLRLSIAGCDLEVGSGPSWAETSDQWTGYVGIGVVDSYYGTIRGDLLSPPRSAWIRRTLKRNRSLSAARDALLSLGYPGVASFEERPWVRSALLQGSSA